MAKKVEVEVGSLNLDVLTRREGSVMTIDNDNRDIVIRYREVKYYIDGSSGQDVEVVISTTSKSYNADYDEMEASAVGLAITEMVQARLSLDDPANPV